MAFSFVRWRVRVWVWVLLALCVLVSAKSKGSWDDGVVIESQQRLGQEEHNLGKELGEDRTSPPPSSSQTPINPLEELHHALETLQSRYFQLWVGTWPSTIDWTAAVTSTYVSASLNSLTRSLKYYIPSVGIPQEGPRVENEINRYFSQSVAYYFGENAFAIRNQANDDMLWVVLEWLESIKFVDLHSKEHFPGQEGGAEEGDGEGWYGRQFVPAFAHRARIFYDLAARGWDTRLCDGGMIWNPRLLPYKNAITNQLYISASVGMYLYFPGDDNGSPFQAQNLAFEEQHRVGSTTTPARAHDRRYILNAIEAYNWLKNSNMTNAQGLYVDGFHITNYGKNNTIGTGKCDERNEMVYTYNQGVLLSGLRGLFEGTGDIDYLTDAHQLVRNVIRATGWSLAENMVTTSTAPEGSGARSNWSGLGRAGILEEYCDHSGTCSQDGQTFKGIFFHHLNLLCEPLLSKALLPGKTVVAQPWVRNLHKQSCRSYAPWIARNARAALRTRDQEGAFGMWWGKHDEDDEEEVVSLPMGAVDWRNDEGVYREFVGSPPLRRKESVVIKGEGDVNDRGRGRTVETQGGGVSVVRALWEFVNSYE